MSIEGTGQIVVKQFKGMHSLLANHVHNRQALQLLKNIEQQSGPTDPKVIKQSDDYAISILGNKKFAPWLYVYSAVAGEFREGWIPDNYYGKIVLPKIKGETQYLSRVRALSNRIFSTDLFPDIMYYDNAIFTDANFNIISPNHVLKQLYADNERIVFKTNSSHRGKGTHIISKSDFDIDEIIKYGGGTFQRYINQHPFFDQFTANSVATIRVTTVVLDDGRIETRAAFLRLGRESDVIVKSESHIRVAIDIMTGLLHRKGYLPGFQSLLAHPDSEIKFEGLEIPEFAKLKKTVEQLHSHMPFNRCIGWDVIVDVDGQIAVMEWNGGPNDVKFSEATTGPNFSDLHWEKLAQK